MNIGIVGISGFGGAELLRLCVLHPTFDLTYIGGEASAGKSLEQLYPALVGQRAGKLVVQPFVPEQIGELDVLFVSLPTGKSREVLARVPMATSIVDVGGDHRFVQGWTYGLTELPGQRERIRQSTRIANPGCYPAAVLLALAPLLAQGLIEPEGIIVDAVSGVTGAGRGGRSDFSYVDTSEDVFAYGLDSHSHVAEMEKALAQVAGKNATVAFTPKLVPMKRGILATCHARPRGNVTDEKLFEVARALYANEAFVRVIPPHRGRSPHTRWATGSNLAFLSYAVNARTGHVVAFGAIDNLGKGAAGQALQNANVITGQPEFAGLRGLPLLA